MKMRYIFLVIAATLLIMSCSQKREQEIASEESDGVGQFERTWENIYILDDVSKHNSSNDCWIVIGQKVYDVTKFIRSHPGGNAILEGCGKDATHLFETRPMGSGTPHSSDARDILDNYYIGDMEEVS